jgi:hypothetical protein
MVGASPNNSSSGRVPLILQNIFTSSQRGDDVAKIQAPSNGLGFKMFRKTWGRKQKKGKGPIQAPSSNSLSSERSGGSRTGSRTGSRNGTVETAADASRKAMKQKKKTQPESPVSNTRVFSLGRLLVALTMIISHLFTHSCSF